MMGGIIGGRIASAELVATPAGQVAAQASYTFTSVALGAEKASRYIVVCVHIGSGLLLNRPISGVTIGGVAATVHRQDVSPVNFSTRSGIAGLAVPTGASANIVVSLSGGNAISCAISVYALYDLDSTTPFAVNGSGTQTGTSVATTLNIPSRGIAIAAITSRSPGSNVTVSGLTEDVDVANGADARVTAASLERMSAETARAVSASGANTGWGLSAASWA